MYHKYHDDGDAHGMAILVKHGIQHQLLALPVSTADTETMEATVRSTDKELRITNWYTRPATHAELDGILDSRTRIISGNFNARHLIWGDERDTYGCHIADQLAEGDLQSSMMAGPP